MLYIQLLGCLIPFYMTYQILILIFTFVPTNQEIGEYDTKQALQFYKEKMDLEFFDERSGKLITYGSAWRDVHDGV